MFLYGQRREIVASLRADKIKYVANAQYDLKWECQNELTREKQT